MGEFEGPIDLLLTLIEKRKMHISEVSLAAVADSYLDYVKRLDEMPLADSTHFVYVAATLLLIKSRSLLPNMAMTAEEEADIEELERRLKIFQRIKQQIPAIKEQFGKNVIFAREEDRNRTVVFHPPEETSQENLLTAIMDVLRKVPKVKEIPQAIVRKVVSLEERIGDLAGRMKKTLKMSFKEFSQDHKERVNVVVSFLAMLELVKQGMINVNQHQAYGDIAMESLDSGTPEYT